MSLSKALGWTAASIFIKILTGLLLVKLLAVSFGPSNIGLAGNFRQLITLLGMVASAGILNGVTKYVAKYQDDPFLLRAVVGTSSAMVLGSSLLLGLFLLLAAHPISQGLFGNKHYQGVMRLVALVPIGIGWATLILALMKGFQDVKGNALVLILGSVVGIIAYYFCYRFGGYKGALFGLALVPSLIVIPAVLILACRGNIPLFYFRPQWNTVLAIQLCKFTLMTLSSSFTIPVAYIMMRNKLAAHYSWNDVGIWQGMNSISDAYLQFMTALFGVWLLPTLSCLDSKKELIHKIFYSLRYLLPTALGLSLSVWLLRDMIIWLLFSEKFIAMRDLFFWQFFGNILKVGAYVFGYLVITNTLLVLSILAEISQFILLITLSNWLIPLNGALGAAQAYMGTYLVYFVGCYGVFLFWCRRT